MKYNCYAHVSDKRRIQILFRIKMEPVVVGSVWYRFQMTPEQYEQAKAQNIEIVIESSFKVINRQGEQK